MRFGISPFYSRYYLPLLLPPLINQYPHLRYEIMENYSSVIERAIIDGKLDFCLVPLLPKNPLLVYEPIYQETILLAVPKDSPVNKSAFSVDHVNYIDLQAVRNVPFIALKSVQKVSEYSKQLCEHAGFTPSILCETMNWDTLNQLVSTGLGVGFVPDLLVNQLEEDIRPCYYHLLPEARRVYTIAYRQGDTLSPSARIMIEVFRREFNHFAAKRPLL